MPPLPDSYHDSITERLSAYTPCDVADSLVKHGIAHGGYIPHLVQYSKDPDPRAGSVSGRAYTVEYAPLNDPRPALKGGYIDTAPTGSVIVIATSPGLQTVTAPFTRISNALYGGLMSTRAQYLGAKGTVVLGKIRDVKEHNALGYPVFAYGLGITAPSTVVKAVAANRPIIVKVVSQAPYGERDYEQRVINPGDYVVADENGVAVIPAGNPNFVNSVLAAIPPRVEADALVAEDIKNGQLAGESQKKRREGL